MYHLIKFNFSPYFLKKDLATKIINNKIDIVKNPPANIKYPDALSVFSFTPPPLGKVVDIPKKSRNNTTKSNINFSNVLKFLNIFLKLFDNLNEQPPLEYHDTPHSYLPIPPNKKSL